MISAQCQSLHEPDAHAVMNIGLMGCTKQECLSYPAVGLSSGLEAYLRACACKGTGGMQRALALRANPECALGGRLHWRPRNSCTGPQRGPPRALALRAKGVGPPAMSQAAQRHRSSELPCAWHPPSHVVHMREDGNQGDAAVQHLLLGRTLTGRSTHRMATVRGAKSRKADSFVQYSWAGSRPGCELAESWQ